jgi:hypothetical protein
MSRKKIKQIDSIRQNSLETVMPTGAQNTVSVKDSSSSSGYYTKREILINTIQLWKLGATDRKVTLRTVESSASSYILPTTTGASVCSRTHTLKISFANSA